MSKEYKTYKLAFIGGSINSIAGYPHFIASQLDRRFKVTVGSFSRNEEINEETAKKWRVKKLYNNWQDMIIKERNNIDAVVVLTHTPTHYKIIQQLLKFNLPIICEKPLVSSLKEINKLEEEYDMNEHFIIVTNNYSGYPMVRELQNKIENKELGNILSVRLQMAQESFLRSPITKDYPQKWRLIDNFIPTISLDLGIHLHHLSYFFLQKEPIELISNYNSLSEYNVIDDVNIMFKYENNTTGNMWLSKTALGNRNGLEIEIYGDKASALWIQEDPEKLKISIINGESIIIDRGSSLKVANKRLYNRMTAGHPSGFIESLSNLYTDIANELDIYFSKSKKTRKIQMKYLYGFDHAKNGINFLHSASISNNKRKWVNIKKDRNEF